MGFSQLAGLPDTQMATGGPGQPSYYDQTPDFQMANNNMADTVSLNYETGQQKADANAGPPVEKIVTKFDENGEPSYDFHGVSERTKQWLTEMAGIGVQTKNAFDQAANLVRAKREFLTENPVLGQLGAIASHAAAAYQAPYSPIQGLVRGAGVYGLGMFGQTPQELATEEAGLRSQEVRAVSPVAAEMIAADRDERYYQMMKAREAHWAQTEKTRAMSEAERNLTAAVSSARVSGDYTPGVLHDMAISHGLDEAAANQWEARGMSAFDAYQTKRKEDSAQKWDEFQKEQQARHQWALRTAEDEMRLRQKYGEDPATQRRVDRMSAITTQYGKGLETADAGAQKIHDLYSAFQIAGAQGFQTGDVPVEKMYSQLMGALGSGKVKTPGMQKTEADVTDIIRSAYGMDPNEPLKPADSIRIRSDIQKAHADYVGFQGIRGQLEDQHEMLRKALPKEMQDSVSSLKPGRYNAPTAPGKPAAPSAPAAGGPNGPAPAAPPTNRLRATSKSGRPIYSDDNGRTWLYGG